MSTLGRDDVLRLAEVARAGGVRMMELPVTGGVHLAAQGKITMLPLGPIHHNVKEHYFDRENTLPDGRTYSQTVIDAVAGILEHDKLPDGRPANTPM